eukprot:gnl/TRDRNA2_/TRDRNA2_154318_c0_seq1.p1 gnl/TRDRNA2_/TRDRNA2_154318_c0~~gnl/TRDRNA2_/TRDRNA2_154318_c0_seq1.p1  ORF type:complete len:237 (+),score=19.62 gnl/TRDRNA2_/TRDRNA2_154318_c0_seq1:75-785(+)
MALVSLIRDTVLCHNECSIAARRDHQPRPAELVSSQGRPPAHRMSPEYAQPALQRSWYHNNQMARRMSSSTASWHLSHDDRSFRSTDVLGEHLAVSGAARDASTPGRGLHLQMQQGLLMGPDDNGSRLRGSMPRDGSPLRSRSMTEMQHSESMAERVSFSLGRTSPVVGYSMAAMSPPPPPPRSVLAPRPTPYVHAAGQGPPVIGQVSGFPTQLMAATPMPGPGPTAMLSPRVSLR